MKMHFAGGLLGHRIEDVEDIIDAFALVEEE
jgi:hypothetical protein